MAVLHIQWHPPITEDWSLSQTPGTFLVWGENEAATQLPSSRLTVRVRARPHPYANLTPEIRQLATVAGLNLPIRYAPKITLYLPTIEYGPLPSATIDTPQNDEVDPADNLTIINPWQTEGLRLSPPRGLTLLTTLLYSEALPPHLSLGQSTLFWLSVAHWAMTLVTESQIKLTEKTKLNQPEQWIATLDSARAQQQYTRFRALLPHTYLSGEANVEPANPDQLLTTALNAFIDSLVQRRPHLSFDGILGRIRKLASSWLIKNLQPTTETESSLNLAELILYRNYDYWHQHLYLDSNSSFQIAARLEAPPPSATPVTQANGKPKQAINWSLHFLLQSRQDPSLLIMRNALAQRRLPSFTARQLKQMRDLQVRGIRYANNFLPKVAVDAAQTEPTSLSLQQAYAFLRHSAPLLEAAGIGILVPPWWGNESSAVKLRLTLTPQEDPPNGNGHSQQSLVQYQWDVALGDVTLSREEFEALVALKMPLVEMRGKWVELDSNQLEAALRFWDSQDMQGNLTPLEAMRLGLGTPEKMDDLPVELVQYKGWLADWVDTMTQPEKLSTLPPPTSLKAQLRPYQTFGYSWLDFMHRRGLGVILADDMGLGKTIQTLTTILKDKEANGKLPGPILIVCPTSVVTNWHYEVERFTPTLKTLIHQGPNRLRDEAFRTQVSQVDLVLTSYTLVRLEAEAMQQINWYGVILDEAQNIKNPSTKQTQAIRALPARFRMALTGTPIENRLGELWSIMHFLNPGYLSNRKAFQSKFARPIERQQNEEAATQLRQMITPFILRRLKTDPTVIQDLPEKQESKVYCYLSKEQATLYEATVKSALAKMDKAQGIQRRGIILGLLTRLKQICNHPAQFLHQINDGALSNPASEMRRSGKLTRLHEILEELISVGDHSLIFTQFTEMGRLLTTYIEQTFEVKTLFLHGGVPAQQRRQMIDRFQNEVNGPPIFILSLKAGGTGLNLTRANQVFHFDRWWNPAVENQATDRAFRIGQKRPVQVYKFICQGTLEDRIDAMIESKKALADQVVGQGENWLTELTSEELQDLVALQKNVFS